MPNFEEMINKQNSTEAIDFIFNEVSKTIQCFNLELTRCSIKYEGSTSFATNFVHLKQMHLNAVQEDQRGTSMLLYWSIFKGVIHHEIFLHILQDL